MRTPRTGVAAKTGSKRPDEGNANPTCSADSGNRLNVVIGTGVPIWGDVLTTEGPETPLYFCGQVK